MELMLPHPMHVVAFLAVWTVGVGILTETAYALCGWVSSWFDTLRLIHRARVERGRTLSLEDALYWGDPNDVGRFMRLRARAGRGRRDPDKEL